MPPAETDQFCAEFTALDALADTFQKSIFPHELQAAAITPALLLTHALAQTASIQLHRAFAPARTLSRARCLAAARAVVGLAGRAQLQEIEHISPFVGVSARRVPARRECPAD